MNLQDSVVTAALIQNDLLLYKHILNNTSCDSSCNRIEILKKYRRQLAELKTIPIIKQRTAEWYAARNTRLTASDLEEAISNNHLKLAKKKAGIVTPAAPRNAAGATSSIDDLVKKYSR